MRHLTYIGPHDEVEVRTPFATWAVKHGDSAEFPDEIAESLLAQETWKTPAKAAKALKSEEG